MREAMREPTLFPEYERHRGAMKFGDVIAFSGRGGSSEIIKQLSVWKGGREISHVGMVYPSPDSSVLILESTTLVDLPDAVDRSIHKGVQLHWLSKRLSNYDGEAWWVPLKTPFDAIASLEVYSWCRRCHEKKIKYDTIQALGAGLDFWDSIFENERDYSKLFCSEMVSRALQLGRKIGRGVNPSEVMPFEVVSFPCLVESPVKIK